MTIFEALKLLETSIQENYHERDVTFPAIELLTNITGKSKLSLLSSLRDELTTAEDDRFGNLVHQIAKQKPIQYIIGYTTFYGDRFNVTPHTLIPRPETESLVESAVAYLNERTKNIINTPRIKLSVIDIGTGSGAIVISIAKHVQRLKPFIFYATDISEPALSVAKANAKVLPIQFIKTRQDGLFPPRPAPEKYDLITANLPYLSETECKELPTHIKEYEPKSALLGGKIGTEIVESLLDYLPYRLTQEGIALIELPPVHQTWLAAACRKRHLAVEKLDTKGTTPGFVWKIEQFKPLPGTSRAPRHPLA